jgi:hypothetical protein
MSDDLHTMSMAGVPERDFDFRIGQRAFKGNPWIWRLEDPQLNGVEGWMYDT